MALFECGLKFEFSGNKEAKTVLASISPDLLKKNPRSATIVNIKNACISINIKANDRTALKASLNSCFKSIILSESLLEVI